MANKRDGSWEAVGSKLRDSLRDEYELCSEGCVYVNMVTLEDHNPIDWDDHEAVHSLFVLAHGGYENQPAWPYRLPDTPALRESIRNEFKALREEFDKSFEDERDVYADRYAIVALRGINAFISEQMGPQ